MSVSKFQNKSQTSLFVKIQHLYVDFVCLNKTILPHL